MVLILNFQFHDVFLGRFANKSEEIDASKNLLALGANPIRNILLRKTE